MKGKILLFLIGGVMLVGMVSAFGHHSVTATYDGEQEVTLKGKLVLFLWRNPHAFVHVDVPDAAGKVQRWTIEWGGAQALTSQGVKRDTFKVGDELIITGNPSRTKGEPRAKMNTLKRTSDGFGWGTKPGEVVD
jgi:hypothetical protein